MALLAWALIGLVTGMLAGLAYRTPVPGGQRALLATGVTGGVLGGFVGIALTGASLWTVYSTGVWALALVGALALLALQAIVTGDMRARADDERSP
jgi:uncharacterized membrane protein YeaQ/YmgE (transglycosylase-associated protein family)